MATPTTDYTDDVPDADAVQANITAQDDAAIAKGGNFAQRSSALIQAGSNGIAQAFGQLTGDQTIGDPRVVQARRIQTAMSQILQEANVGADPNEPPLDRQQRLSTAVAAGMAGISPQIAMKAAQQSVALQEAKNQQGLLLAQTQNVQARTEEDKANLTLKKLGANYITYGTVTGKDGLEEYQPVGEVRHLYGPDGQLNPEFTKQVLADGELAKANGIQSPQFSTVNEFQNSKANVALIRAKAMQDANDKKLADKAALSQAVANTPEDDLRYMAGVSIFQGMNAAVKSKGDNAQLYVKALDHYKAAKGITPIDETMAQAEIQGLRSGERAVGTRAGNTTILMNELSGLGQNVQDTLDKVDRSRVPLINAAIRAGATGTLGSGPEAAYAAALTAFTTAHGRLIAGATGVTSDAARDKADSLVTGTQSPEAVKAALRQIVSQELPVINQASTNAIGVLANHKNFPGIMKINNALGYPVEGMIPPGAFKEDAAASSPNAPAPKGFSNLRKTTKVPTADTGSVDAGS